MTLPRFSRLACLTATLAAACTAAAPRATTIDGARTMAAPAPATFSASAPLSERQRRWVDSTLASLSLRDRVGQMVMVWMLGDYSSSGDSAFAEEVRWVEQDHVGGVAMSLGTPVEVASKLNYLQRRAPVPLLAGCDLEPGLGRLEGGVFAHYLMDAGSATVFPSAMAIAATGRDDDALDVGRVIGEEARAVGIQIDFAPVVDVNNNPSNPVINTRSFGEDPARVAKLSALFVRGLAEGGAAATAKHFPGHGNTDVDSHVGLPVVTGNMAELDSVELVPFRAAVQAGAGLVMTAHIALPAVNGDSTTPATLAPSIITGLLRDSVGFRGVAITDAMTMGGIGKGYGVEESSVLAVKAGADILLKPSDVHKAIDAVVAAVERGEIPASRIDASVRRILELKARLGLADRRTVDLDHLREVVGSPQHRAIAADIARRAVTLLRDRDALLPLPPNAAPSVAAPGTQGGAAPGTATRTLVVQYMPESELKAGHVFGPTLRAALPRTRVVKITPNTDAATLDSVAKLADSADRIVVAPFVRRVEGEGRFAVPAPIAAWIDTLAQRHKVIVAAFGNPYLIRQFPSVGTYLVTYAVGDDLERAAAYGILGRQPITGRIPVSLPGFFTRGDGIQLGVASGTR